MAPIAMGTLPFEDEALTHARQQLVELAETCGVKADDVHVVIGSLSVHAERFDTAQIE